MKKVSIVKCDDYTDKHLLKKISSAISLVTDLSSLIKKGTTVLIKPNIVTGDNPKKAINTHPALVWAVGQIINDLGGNIWIGDSPVYGSPLSNAKASGIYEVVEKLNAKFIPFSEPITVNFPQGKCVKHFLIEKAVLAADIIINIAKLKTHGFMYLSGAVKNLYGCVFEKTNGHIKMPDRNFFGEMLVDLNLLIKPQLHLMDAIIGMEGDGPTNGIPKKIGLIMASSDPFALDVTACEVIGLSPHSVPFIQAALKRKLPSSDKNNLKIVGTKLEEVKIQNFDLIKPVTSILTVGANLLKIFTLEKPSLVLDKCKFCYICKKICPAKAIKESKKGPHFNYQACIYCYCCQEACPHGAIKIKRKGLLAHGILRLIEKFFYPFLMAAKKVKYILENLIKRI